MRDFRILRRSGAGFRDGKHCFVSEEFEVRVMAEAEGWAMVRRKGAVPFLCRSSELAAIGLCGKGCGFPNCQCQLSGAERRANSTDATEAKMTTAEREHK